MMAWSDPRPPVFHYEFEFIHPFADGNGRVGRLWQTLILTRWNPLFADIPVESLVYEHQAEYYQALQKSTDQTDSAPFIELMLTMIPEAISTVTPQFNPQVVRLLEVMQDEMTREALQSAIFLFCWIVCYPHIIQSGDDSEIGMRLSCCQVCFGYLVF